MNLEAILPIIDQIVKDSLSQKVYTYGRTSKGTTSRVASGRLRDSIKSVIVENKQGVQVIQMEAFGQPLVNTYAYWLINDRQPGSAPSSAIEKWIREKKSFRIRDFKTGQFLPKNEKNIKSAAYVIARSLKKFGYQNKPKNFWEISVEKIENNPQILELIAEATFDDLYQALEGI
jgi:hypothetical protein